MARRNVAAASNGGVASALSTATNYAASGAINGDRSMTNWGANGGWASSGSTPQWLQVDFSGTMTINEIDAITSHDAGLDPVDTDTAGDAFRAQNFTVQYWDGTTWQILSTVTGNTKAWRQFSYTAFPTTKIRINVTSSGDTVARIVELEAWGDDVVVPRMTLLGVG